MFFHIYKARIKCMTRDRQLMFWTLLFPIILGTLFYMTFSNIAEGEMFREIEIAVVQNKEFKDNKEFKTALDSVDLFNVNYTSKTEADNLLEENRIAGYVHLDDEIKMVVKNSDINQSILKLFLDDFSQSHSTVMSIVSANPDVVSSLLEDVADRKNFFDEVPIGRSKPDTTVNFFYALIAMTCFYGSFLGLKEVMAIQANQSDQGARVNLAPTHKMKVFAVSMLAAVTIQLLETLILISYLIFVLKIDFGNQLAFIGLTCVIGTLTGVSYGSFLAAISKKKEGVKIGILIGSTMTMTFFAGMMSPDIKIMLSSKIPLLSYLNPANLITDAFYSLYFYTSHSQYFLDIALLCGFTLIFSLSTYLVLRRQKYASL